MSDNRLFDDLLDSFWNAKSDVLKSQYKDRINSEVSKSLAELEAEIKAKDDALKYCTDEECMDQDRNLHCSHCVAKKALSPKPRSEYLKAEVSKAVNNFKRYIRHDNSCDYLKPIEQRSIALPCSCGLDGLLSEIEGEV